jgi:P-type Cu2+ transporter
LALAGQAGEIRLGSRRFCGLAEGDEADGPELFLTRPGHEPRRFAFADTLRPDASSVVAALKIAGKRVILLSGDRAAVVAGIAGRLGIAEWQAEVTPADKCARLAVLAAEGAKVMMVGDGLNDAPALAAAHVSMSPASAADISQNAADIVFQGASLAAVTEVLALARRSVRFIHQNIVMAIGYNAFAVPLAMLGFVTPLIAAAAMSSSSLIVVGNALRLGRLQRKGAQS